MNLVFADTFYYCAFLNRQDAHHEQVLRLAQSLEARLLTTGWVLTELADGLSGPRWRRGVAEVVQDAMRNPGVIFVAPDLELFSERLDLYTRRPDKEWSLTDCISFVVMQRHHVADALTADHHFEQAGFNILLK